MSRPFLFFGETAIDFLPLDLAFNEGSVNFVGAEPSEEVFRAWYAWLVYSNDFCAKIGQDHCALAGQTAAPLFRLWNQLQQKGPGANP
jgi:hypothetical protein